MASLPMNAIWKAFDKKPRERFRFGDTWWYTTAWSDAARLATEDVLEQEYHDQTWLQEFLPSAEIPTSRSTAIEHFNLSRDKFMADSSRTIQWLQSYEHDFRLQELTHYMLNLPQDLGSCFLDICTELAACQKSQALRSDNLTKSNPPPRHDDQGRESATRHHLHQEILDTILTQKQRYAGRTANWPKDSTLSALNVVSDLSGILTRVDKKWGGNITTGVVGLFTASSKHDHPPELLELLEKSGVTIKYEYLCAGSHYRIFVDRVRRFVEVVTGQTVHIAEDSNHIVVVQSLFEKLRQYGTTKWEQFVPLYHKIEELNDTIEQQQQMITALAYRHVMEHLPNQDHYKSMLSQTKPPKLNEKDYWKMMWEDMVKQEMSYMLNSDFTQRDLSSLFEFSFRQWRRDNKSKTSIPREVYIKWPNYRRGEDLYSELSNNIHFYQGNSETAYDVHESNWSRTDRTILRALKPRISPSQTKVGDPDLPATVDWAAEFKVRGLPFEKAANSGT